MSDRRLNFTTDEGFRHDDNCSLNFLLSVYCRTDGLLYTQTRAEIKRLNTWCSITPFFTDVLPASKEKHQREASSVRNGRTLGTLESDSQTSSLVTRWFGKRSTIVHVLLLVTDLETCMDELDEHLQQLALEAQEHSDALKRQQLIMKLWGTIYSSPRFPQRSHVKRRIFIGDPDEVYDDATHHLMEYLLRNISNYDPERGEVMAWVSDLLRKRFVPDAIERVKREQSRIEPKRNSKDSNGKEKTQFDVETLASATPDPSKIRLLLIQKCLEEDEDNQFKEACMKEYPFVNFRDVALKHHIDGLKFTEIAHSFSIPYTSLKSFYDRQLKKYTPKIRRYVENTILT